MEFINWKNILLEWANRLNFLGRPYYSLNLAEIESFYSEFQTNMSSVNIASKKLESFIKSYYPEFLPEWNKEGKMCPDDYVYGYSLLMFFSCVTYPEEKMHKICKGMQGETQVVIKTFLQNMLVCNSFSREAIRNVIESSAPAKVSDYVLALSPNKVNEINTCPPTPRTKILNEWNSENRQLKALVETERYEKGFLELQLKKKEEQIDNLTQERRKFMADIQNLKSQLNEKDTENVPPNSNTEPESLKRRLRQEITEKDGEIKDLQNQVTELSTAKQLLAEKYSYVESLYNKSVICSTEMTVKLEELSETCDKQQQQIKGLEINIKEYQKYFNESSSKGNSLDTSLDNLDDSYAIAMANLSNRSMSSPENLGKVVDIQLREQILLYDQLFEKSNQLEIENNELKVRIEEHMTQFDSLELTRIDLEAKVNQSEEDKQKLIEENSVSATEIEAIRKEFLAKDESSRMAMESLQSELNRLETVKSENLKRIEELQKIIDANASDQTFKDKCSEWENLLTENKRLLKSTVDEKENLNAELGKLKAECNECRKQIADLVAERKNGEDDCQRVIAEKDLLQSHLSAVEVNRADLETRLNSLELTRIDLETKLNQSEEDKQKLIEENSVSATEIEAIRKESLAKDASNRIAMESLKSELNRLETVKSENLKRVEELQKIIDANASDQTFKDKCSEWENLLTENKRLLKSTVDEKENLNAELGKLMAECNECRKQIADLVAERKNGEDDCQRVIAEKDLLQSHLSVVEVNRADLETRLNSLELTRIDLETKLNQSEEDKQKLIEENSVSATEIEAIRKESLAKDASNRIAMESLKSELNRLETVKSENLKRVEELQKIIDANASDQTFKDKCSEWENLLTENKRLLKSTVDEKENLNAELGKLMAECNECRKQIADLVAERKNGEDDCQRVIAEKDLLQSHLSAVEVNRADLETRLNSLELTRIDLETKLNQSEEDKQKLIEENSVSATEIEAIRKESLAKDASNRMAMESLKSELNRLETVKSGNLKRIEELQKIIDANASDQTFKDKCSEWENLLTENKRLLKSTVDEKEYLNAELGKLMAECNECRKQIADLVAERKNGEDDCQRVIAEKDLLQKQVSALEVNRAHLETRLNSVELTRIDLEAQLIQSEEEKEKLFFNLQVKTDEAEAIELTLKGLSEQYESEAGKCQRLVETNKSNCEAYDIKIAKAEENKTQLEAAIEDQKLSIEKLNIQVENLSTANSELVSQLSRCKMEFETESCQRSTNYKAEMEALLKSTETLNLRVKDLTIETDELRKDLEKARRENVSLTDENVDLATEIEKVRNEFSASNSTNREEMDSLKSELNRLETVNSDNHQLIEELKKSNDLQSKNVGTDDKCSKLEADLKIALADLEAKIQECHQGQEIYKQLVNDNKILSAKLTKHREMTSHQEDAWQKERSALTEQREKACTEIRFELEGKLNKMKERMKHIYTEETSKSKEKHEKQERELVHYKNQCQLLSDKVDKYVNHVQTISEQLYRLNEQILDLKKENEFLKSKLRLAENNPREKRLFSAPNFGPNLKMEDEEGEVFNNTYLADLKSGISRASPIGRESIRHSELHQRNSIAARHLRSTYAAQYGDQNLREEDISMPYLNDSMFSNQLDVRRGTLYQRPGPPTPSKNGGRLSFGGSIVNASDLFPKDILREQNTNAKTKTTPGKLMSMFSSSKHKENPTPKKRLSIFKKKTNL